MSYYFSKNWIYFEKFGFHINLSNPFETKNKIFKAFQSPRCKFKIIKRKSFPWIFGHPRGKIFDFQTHDVFWKDKYDSPRFEGFPQISITLFNLITFLWYWEFDTEDIWTKEQYWEQVLWYIHYYKSYDSDKPDIELAEKHWPWQNLDGTSTWNKDFLIYDNLY